MLKIEYQVYYKIPIRRSFMKYIYAYQFFKSRIIILTIHYYLVGRAINHKHCSNITEFLIHQNDKSRIKNLWRDIDKDNSWTILFPQISHLYLFYPYNNNNIRCALKRTHRQYTRLSALPLTLFVYDIVFRGRYKVAKVITR